VTVAGFPIWQRLIQERIEEALGSYLPSADSPPVRLHQAMRYVTLGGGKRVRPLLCHAAGEIFGAPLAALDQIASAVEMIHVYSLVHDDLPAMDNDVLRRGKPTCHVQFDEATALLVGDALQSLAFHVAAQSIPNVTAARQLDMLALLANAAGSRGMAGGQAIDLAATGQSLEIVELEFMHVQKTGQLIQAATLLGAHVGGAQPDELHNLAHFANRIGLLFQVIDDILDAEASTDALGKTAGKDAAANKATYLTLLGSKPARALADRLCNEAHEALSSFGDNALRLHQLTDYIVVRKN
jgi:farnesyl diphosphate synthase